MTASRTACASAFFGALSDSESAVDGSSDFDVEPTALRRSDGVPAEPLSALSALSVTSSMETAGSVASPKNKTYLL